MAPPMKDLATSTDSRIREIFDKVRSLTTRRKLIQPIPELVVVSRRHPPFKKPSPPAIGITTYPTKADKSPKERKISIRKCATSNKSKRRAKTFDIGPEQLPAIEEEDGESVIRSLRNTTALPSVNIKKEFPYYEAFVHPNSCLEEKASSFEGVVSTITNYHALLMDYRQFLLNYHDFLFNYHEYLSARDELNE